MQMMKQQVDDLIHVLSKVLILPLVHLADENIQIDPDEIDETLSVHAGDIANQLADQLVLRFTTGQPYYNFAEAGHRKIHFQAAAAKIFEDFRREIGQDQVTVHNQLRLLVATFRFQAVLFAADRLNWYINFAAAKGKALPLGQKFLALQPKDFTEWVSSMTVALAYGDRIDALKSLYNHAYSPEHNGKGQITAILALVCRSDWDAIGELALKLLLELPPAKRPQIKASFAMIEGMEERSLTDELIAADDHYLGAHRAALGDAEPASPAETAELVG